MPTHCGERERPSLVGESLSPARLGFSVGWSVSHFDCQSEFNQLCSSSWIWFSVGKVSHFEIEVTNIIVNHFDCQWEFNHWCPPTRERVSVILLPAEGFKIKIVAHLMLEKLVAAKVVESFLCCRLSSQQTNSLQNYNLKFTYDGNPIKIKTAKNDRNSFEFKSH